MAELLDMGRRLPVAFFQWWFDELRGLLPRSLATTSPSSKSSLILSLKGEDAVLIERTARHGERELDRAGGDALDELGPVFPPFSDRRYRKWPIVVRLSGELGLRKVVDLPLAARENLDQLLHFELDRLTPFRADDVCYAWRILETDAGAGRMQVELEMAPKTVVDRAVSLIGKHGREVDRIEIEGGDDRQALDLMPRVAEAKPRKGWLRRLLPLIALGLGITAVMLPMNKQQQHLGRIEQDISVLRAEAEESLAIREELDSLTEKAGFLAAAKNKRLPMTEILAELTKAMPDHSHIVQLQIQGAKVDLNGLADRASDLIAILDQSPILTSPHFRSPVTRDPRSNKERFQISVDLVEKSP